jgi:uncharacterized protein
VRRVVLDTNVMLSGLINPLGSPARILDAWLQRRFDLVTSAEQLLELGEVMRRPALRARIPPVQAGRFINDLRELALVVRRLPHVDRSIDPADNFLLAMAEGSDADVLVSGDQRGVVALRRHGRTAIVDVRTFRAELER